MQSHGKAAGAGEVPTSNLPSQETGANDDDYPFRVKRRNVSVRAIRRLLPLFLLISAVAAAADLRVRVTDPQGASVYGARVVLLREGKIVAARSTAADGVAIFPNPQPNAELEVFAPGFALYTARLGPEPPALTDVKLSPASVSTTVTVTAARTPLTTEDANASSAVLESRQIDLMQPVSTGDAMRFLPGAVVADAGQRGGQTSLFVRGGESRYNKVIVDGVSINDPGGIFDFGVVPMDNVDRVEFVRGAESTLYGSDAMTSVVQFFSRNGSSTTPELRFGADGGTFETAHGYASFSGLYRRFDYNVFADQFNTNGQGINDEYSNSSQGGNLGFALSQKFFLRFHVRHNNSRTGVQGEWNFNGDPLLPPDSDARARQNNFLASTELNFTAGKWQHRVVGFEYNHQRTDTDFYQDPGRVSPLYGNIDYPYSDFANINRAGLDYQGEYWERSWSRTTFGYHFEDENGFVGDYLAPPSGHGLRRNHAVYGQQVLAWRRVTAIAGVRFVHNESFGNRAVPEVSLGYLLWNGHGAFGGLRLRGGYSEGIKEPRFEESFGIGGYFILPNPNLKPEENRALEAGLQQILFGGRYSLSATYFHNLFRNRIDFSVDPVTYYGTYVNVNKAMAQGAEVQLDGRITNRIQLQSGYVYTSTQILEAPLAVNPLLSAGSPLLRRPRHSGNMLLSYVSNRYGLSLGGTFVGPRLDSDFLGFVPPITHTAGYARFDVGAWYNIRPRITAYANIENLFNKKYEDVAGYPALRANFRAGMRFRIGGD